MKLFWLDEAEPEFGVYDYDNYRYYAGPVLEVGNIYPRMYAKTFFDGMTAAGEKQVINLLRCAGWQSEIWRSGVVRRYSLLFPFFA